MSTVATMSSKNEEPPPPLPPDNDSNPTDDHHVVFSLSAAEDAEVAAAAEAAAEAVLNQQCEEVEETAEAVAAAAAVAAAVVLDEVDEKSSLEASKMQANTSTTTMTTPSYVVAAAPQPPDALSAMQEAATLVMQAREEAAKSRKRKGDNKDDEAWDDDEAALETAQIMANEVAAVVAAVAADMPAEPEEDDGTSPPARKKRSPPTRLPWEDRMRQLKEYKAEHGNLLIPIRYKLNPSLGKFVHNTREQYKLFHKKTPDGYKKKCSLTAARIDELEQIGFIWTTERTKRQDEDWLERIKQLEEYKAKHGHCLVPHGYPDDPSFAEWIHRCRTTYAAMAKEEKPSPLVKARMDQLAEMGFSFTVHTDRWMEHWQELKEYKDKHGNCQVPTHYNENPKLGRWVHTQRHQRRLQLKGKKSCLNDERVALLDTLEFSWEVRPCLERPRTTWLTRLEELTTFYQTHKHFRVPADTMPQLHKWCQEQKQRLKLLDKNDGSDKSKRMGPERVTALLTVGFTKDADLGAAPTVMVTGTTTSSIANGTTTTEATETATSPMDILGDVKVESSSGVQHV